jgi:hypothetical protein
MPAAARPEKLIATFGEAVAKKAAEWLGYEQPTEQPAKQEQPAKSLLAIPDFSNEWCDVSKIPLRRWLYGQHYIRGFATASIAERRGQVDARHHRRHRHGERPRAARRRRQRAGEKSGTGTEKSHNTKSPAAFMQQNWQALPRNPFQFPENQVAF